MEQQHPLTKIAVLSDTHLPDAGTLPLRLLGQLDSVDLIIHLGDFCDLETYKTFQKIAPLVAVYGNMDEPEVKSLLPEKKKLEIHGYNIGLIHGWGPPKNLEKRVVQAFPDVDIVLFGHSHTPLSTTIEEIFVFNPGSATMNTDGSGTFGIIELGSTVTHRIIRLDS